MEVSIEQLEQIIDMLTDETSLYGLRRKLEFEQRAYNTKHYIRSIINGEDCDCALHLYWLNKYGSK